MALAKIVGLAVTPRIPSATSRPSLPSRRYTRVRLSSQGLWPCSGERRWSLVMSSLLSSVVVAGEHIGLGSGATAGGRRWRHRGGGCQPGALAVAVMELVQLVIGCSLSPARWSLGPGGYRGQR